RARTSMRPSAQTTCRSSCRPGSSRSVVSVSAPQLEASITRSFPPVLNRACPSGSSADTFRRGARRCSTSEDLYPGAVARDKAKDACAAGCAKHSHRELGSVSATQVQRARRSSSQWREGHQGTRVERGCHCRIVEKQDDMREESRERT